MSVFSFSQSETGLSTFIRLLSRYLLVTLLACGVITILVWLLTDLDLLRSASVSLGYGVTAVLLLNTALYWIRSLPTWLTAGLALFLGLLLGVSNHFWVVTGEWAPRLLLEQPQRVLTQLVIGGIFTLSVCYFFYTYALSRALQADIEAHKARETQQQHASALAELRVLQSQMEPHFLFNTLANIQGLIDQQPEQAKAMIQALTTLLRRNLHQVRSDWSTLNEELALVSAYLEIQQIRMGERLQWQINLDDELRLFELPPLVLQPLVENAIRHGLEPLPQGGTLTILAVPTLQGCEIQIEDNGIGMQQVSTTEGQGVALNNLRERLALLYDDRAKLRIVRPDEGGTRVVLTLPFRERIAS